MEDYLSGGIVDGVYAYWMWDDLRLGECKDDRMWKRLYEYYCRDNEFAEQIREYWRDVDVYSYRTRFLYFINRLIETWETISYSMNPRIIHEDEVFWWKVVTLYRALTSAIPDKFKYKRNFVMKALNLKCYCTPSIFDKFSEDSEIMIKAIVRRPDLIMRTNLRNDKHFMLQSVKHNGLVLQYLDEQQKLDKDIVFAAVMQNGEAIKYVPTTIIDQELAFEAVMQNGRALVLLESSLRADDKIVKIAKTQCKKAIDTKDTIRWYWDGNRQFLD